MNNTPVATLGAERCKNSTSSKNTKKIASSGAARREKNTKKQSDLGYVYRWTDTKINYCYIGARRGNPTTDRYICSSKKMLFAYRSRPQDFVREILFVGPIEQASQVEHELIQQMLDQGTPCYNIKAVRYVGHLKTKQSVFSGYNLFPADRKLFT